MAFRSIREITKHLVEKARAGQPVTLADKLATIATIEELDGFVAEAKHNGAMTDDLLAEVASRRIDILRARVSA
jgi:predicted transcriptional regulator